MADTTAISQPGEDDENQVIINYDEDFDDDGEPNLHPLQNEQPGNNPISNRRNRSNSSNFNTPNGMTHASQQLKVSEEDEEGVILETRGTRKHSNAEKRETMTHFDRDTVGAKGDLNVREERGYISSRKVAPTSSSTLIRHNNAPGLYIPPRKRQQLQAQKAKESAENNHIDDPASVTNQRETWELLKKDIHGTINRLNITTLKPLLTALFRKSNLIRGRGIVARTLLQASITSPSFAHIYAAFIAVINTKLPEIGELLLARSILAFRRHYRRREKRNATSVCILIGHLINQTLAHELLGLQILAVLLDGDPTNDSVEIAISLTKTIGKHLSEVSPSGLTAILERFRALLQEGSLSDRIQYQLEQLFRIKKSQWEGYPVMLEELDLVEKEDQITFEMGLDEELNKEEILDVFREDPEWIENEKVWKQIQDEILGNDDDENDKEGNGDSTTDGSGEASSGSDSDSNSDSDSDSDSEKNNPDSTALVPTQTQTIQDLSESDLINLRRTIYLTIMSSATFEECAHKLAKTNIPHGRESELINMIIECCSQERTFLRYYALVSARFCLLDTRWKAAFEEALSSQYSTIHRLETNKLRNVAKLFAHLFHTYSFSWQNLHIIRLNEDETTSSSRIFIKILLQEMAEAMGMLTLKQELEKAILEGMFPMDVEKPRDTRFAINFFTSIGLGPLTDGLREFLKNAPKLIMAKAEAERLKEAEQDDGSTTSSELSSSSSSFDSSRSSSSYSDSSTSSSSHSRRKKRGGRRKRRSRSFSSSSSDSRRSFTDSSSRSYSRSPSSSPERNRKSKSSRSRPKKDSSAIPKEIVEKDYGQRDSKSRHKSASRSRSRSYSNSLSRSPESNEKNRKRSTKAKGKSEKRLPKLRRKSESSSPPSNRKSKKGSTRQTSLSSSKRDYSHDSAKRGKKSSARSYSRSISRSVSSSPSSSRSPSPSATKNNNSKSKSRSLRDKSFSRSPSPTYSRSSRSRKYPRSRASDEEENHENSIRKRSRHEGQNSNGSKKDRDSKRRKKRSYSD